MTRKGVPREVLEGRAGPEARRISLEQARDLAVDYFHGTTRSPAEIGIFAFASGHVAWVGATDPADPAALPDSVGGSCIVIDGVTGEVVLRPLLDPETVAARYLAEGTPDGRRSPIQDAHEAG